MEQVRCDVHGILSLVAVFGSRFQQLRYLNMNKLQRAWMHNYVIQFYLSHVVSYVMALRASKSPTSDKVDPIRDGRYVILNCFWIDCFVIEIPEMMNVLQHSLSIMKLCNFTCHVCVAPHGRPGRLSQHSLHCEIVSVRHFSETQESVVSTVQ